MSVKINIVSVLTPFLVHSKCFELYIGTLQISRRYTIIILTVDTLDTCLFESKTIMEL